MLVWSPTGSPASVECCYLIFVRPKHGAAEKMTGDLAAIPSGVRRFDEPAGGSLAERTLLRG